MARYIGAGADVLVLVRVEGLAVLGEVPLDGLVHELAVTGAQVEGDHGGGLLPAGRDRLVRPDIVAGPGGLGLRAAPGRPADARDEPGGVAAVEDLCRLDLPETLAVGDVAVAGRRWRSSLPRRSTWRAWCPSTR